MKNLLVIFILALFTSGAQSQSLTEKDISGTWRVINVLDAGNKPKQAEEMNLAYIDIYSDHNFQIRTKKQDKSSKGYENKFENSKWSYNEATQIINLDKGNMSIKISKSNDKIIFEFPETGLKMEVVMPI